MESALSERQQTILGLIVHEYIETGEPIGSQTLLSRFGLGISTATIRNEMAALTRAGLRRQPHTSGGRSPTEDGYRYFVKGLLGETELPSDEKRLISHQFYQARADVDEWIRLAASVLAHQTPAAGPVGGASPRPVRGETRPAWRPSRPASMRSARRSSGWWRRRCRGQTPSPRERSTATAWPTSWIIPTSPTRTRRATLCGCWTRGPCWRKSWRRCSVRASAASRWSSVERAPGRSCGTARWSWRATAPPGLPPAPWACSARPAWPMGARSRPCVTS